MDCCNSLPTRRPRLSSRCRQSDRCDVCIGVFRRHRDKGPLLPRVMGGALWDWARPDRVALLLLGRRPPASPDCPQRRHGQALPGARQTPLAALRAPTGRSPALLTFRPHLSLSADAPASRRPSLTSPPHPSSAFTSYPEHMCRPGKNGHAGLKSSVWETLFSKSTESMSDQAS